MKNDQQYHQLEIFRQIFLRTLLTFLLLVGSLSSHAQGQSSTQKCTISGLVKDAKGEPILGASVGIKGTGSGTITDSDGKFVLPAVEKGKTIEIKYLGLITQEIVVKKTEKLNVILEEDNKVLGDVVVVGFGQQRKESLVSSITTINSAELKGPTSNLTTMLSGRISGIIAYQRSGEPGQDNANFFIRGLGTFGSGKQDPLILIDGVESSNDDLARLTPDDIAAFSVLKDATAAAVYGARGANGVLIIKTKEGKEGKTSFSFRIENSISMNTQNFKFADNISYMNLANEAALTRNPLAALTYSQTKIDMTKAGADPYLYPNNDWIKQMIKPYTMNQRYNMSAQGGGKKAQYYISGAFNIDNGVLKNGVGNSYNSNVKYVNYSINSTTNLNLTPTTQAIVRVYGQFNDYSGPIDGGGAIFNQVLAANPVAFPQSYSGSLSPFVTHPMYGNAVYANGNQLYSNPYANMVSGYQMYNASTLKAQIEFKQDLNFVLPGLTARAMGYTTRYSYFANSRQTIPSFYAASQQPGQQLQLTSLNSGTGVSYGATEDPTLSYNPGDRNLNSTYYGEASANYVQVFNKVHNVGGMLVSTIRNYVNGNAGDLISSLQSRNVGLAGRFSYDYDHRYLVEFDFGYNGSERFDQGHRWGFFPSVAGGWIISNEKFFEPLKNTINNFKLRASYGEVGNDQIGNSNDRFFYLSQANINDGGYSYRWGQNVPLGGPGYYKNGVHVTQYANSNITWELSKQLNLGVDLSVGAFGLTADAYKQHRTNIYQNRAGIPWSLGMDPGIAIAANVGVVDSKGIDLALTYNKAFNHDLWVQYRANFTYATNKVIQEEQDPYLDKYDYHYAVGHSTTQQWGYIAERLFVDDKEAKNSPDQTAVGGNNQYGAGDIKYRDVNGDGVINSADMVPIGNPTSPEINYGFGGTLGYKQFEFSFFLQGSALSAFFIDPNAISPFTANNFDYHRYGGMITQHGLLQEIASSHWSEDNRNLYAFWPKLSDYNVGNNNARSTWWMRDGSFMRMKSVNIAYNLNKNVLKKLGISNMKIYLDATNLFVISKFKLWDPEMGGNGLGYPVQAVYNIGVSFGI